MKLSDAIRLGAMIRPQAFGQLFHNGGSCAWGAAQEAVGLVDARSWTDLPTEWRTLWPLRDCPAALCERKCDAAMVAHLNDEHHWSRERIADYVATIENMPEPAPSGTLATLSTS